MFPGSSPFRFSSPDGFSTTLRPGTPGASQVLQCISPACHGLRTPADLHILAITDASVMPSVHVKTLGVRIDRFEAVPALQGAHSPLRPTGFSVYAYSIYRSRVTPLLTLEPTLDTGGWPTLTRQGLPPCKIHQALSWRDNVAIERRRAFCGVLLELPC